MSTLCLCYSSFPKTTHCSARLPLCQPRLSEICETHMDLLLGSHVCPIGPGPVCARTVCLDPSGLVTCFEIRTHDASASSQKH